MSAVEIAAGVRGGALRGAICVLAAGLCWSFTGIFLRLAPHFDPWQFLAWRSLGTACAIAIIARIGGHRSLARRLVALGHRQFGCTRCAGEAAFATTGGAVRVGRTRPTSPSLAAGRGT
jgi:drug/metabolite transporter (DMT)-like permease